MVKAINSKKSISTIMFKSLNTLKRSKCAIKDRRNVLWNSIKRKNKFGKLDGDILEQLSSIVLQKDGYIVSLNGANITGSNGDGGIDLKGYKDNTCFIAQCKNISKPVSIKEVRELAGTFTILDKSKFMKHDLIFIASSKFTKPAKQFIKEYNSINKTSEIKIYDEMILQNKIEEYDLDLDKFKSLFGK